MQQNDKQSPKLSEKWRKSSVISNDVRVPTPQADKNSSEDNEEATMDTNWHY